MHDRDRFYIGGEWVDPSGRATIDVLNDYLKDTGKDKADKARPSRVEATKIIEQRTAK